EASVRDRLHAASALTDAIASAAVHTASSVGQFYWTLMPALMMTSCHFLMSAAMRSASCCGVLGSASTPTFAKAAVVFVSRSSALVSVLSRARIGAGVPAGALSACQSTAS